MADPMHTAADLLAAGLLRHFSVRREDPDPDEAGDVLDGEAGPQPAEPTWYADVRGEDGDGYRGRGPLPCIATQLALDQLRLATSRLADDLGTRAHAARRLADMIGG